MPIDILKDEWEDVKFEVIHGDGIYGVIGSWKKCMIGLSC